MTASVWSLNLAISQRILKGIRLGATGARALGSQPPEEPALIWDTKEKARNYLLKNLNC